MFEKTKKFVKEHKAQVIMGAVGVGLVAGAIVTKGRAAKGADAVMVTASKNLDNIPTPEALVNLGADTMIDNYGPTLELMGTTVKTSQMGEFGELLQTIPGVTAESEVWTLLNIHIAETV
jgi:hypothetical protein